MIPRRLTTTITVYPRWVRSDGQIKPMRRTLLRCRPDTRPVSVTLPTGKILQNPTTITIWKQTSGLVYIPPHEWLALPEDELAQHWTVDISDNAHTLIVPWECDYEFDWADSTAKATTAENDFIRSNLGAIRAKQIENNQALGELGGHIVVTGE